jgi:hypothetical protein
MSRTGIELLLLPDHSKNNLERYFQRFFTVRFIPCNILVAMVKPSRSTELGSTSENPSESNSDRNKVKKEPKEEVINQSMGRDRSKRIRGPKGFRKW